MMTIANLRDWAAFGHFRSVVKGTSSPARLAAAPDLCPEWGRAYRINIPPTQCHLVLTKRYIRNCHDGMT